MTQIADKAGLIRIRVQFDAGRVERKFRELPGKMQRSIRRRAMRKALTVVSSALKGELAKHRTRYGRPHLADNVAVVNRNYRKSRRRGTYLLYGAAGVRFGGAPLKVMAKAQAAAPGPEQSVSGYRRTITSAFGRALPSTTVTVAPHTRKGKPRANPYAGFLPGWRWHFIEGGTRRFMGRKYLERITAASRGLVTQTFRDTASQLIRSGR